MRTTYLTLIFSLFLFSCAEDVSLSTELDSSSTTDPSPISGTPTPDNPPSSEAKLNSVTLTGPAPGSRSNIHIFGLNLDFAVTQSGKIFKIFSDPKCSNQLGQSLVNGAGQAVLTNLTLPNNGSADGLVYLYGQWTGEAVCYALGSQYTLDTKAPSAPFGFSISGVTNGGSSSDTSPTFVSASMSHENGTLVKVYDDALCTSEIGQSLISSGSVSVNTNLSSAVDGDRAFHTILQDEAGNSSSCLSLFLTYTLDTTPPNNPTSSWSLQLDGGSSAQSQDTNPVLIVSGHSAEAGGKMEIYLDPACSTKVGDANISHNWQTRITNIQFLGGGLADGLKSFYAKSVDKAQNQSACVTTNQSYTLDTVQPIMSWDATTIPSAPVSGPFFLKATLSEPLCCSYDLLSTYFSATSIASYLFQNQTGLSSFADKLVLQNAKAHFYASPSQDSIWIYVEPLQEGLGSVQLSPTQILDRGGNTLQSTPLVQFTYEKPRLIQFSQTSVAVSEKNGTAQFEFAASEPVLEDVTIHYQIMSSSTATGAHHNLTSGSTVMTNGSQSKSVTFDVFDHGLAQHRILRVGITNLSSTTPSRYQIGPESLAQIVIWDDETKIPDFVDIQIGPATAASTNPYFSGYICGLTSNQKIYCWGSGAQGQLGNGTSSSLTPLAVDSGTDYKKIYAFRDIACGITTADDLKCWGTDASSRLGVAGVPAVGTPQVVDPGQKYKDVSIGNSGGCGVLLDGTLRCWGTNSSSKLTSTIVSSSDIPVTVDNTDTYKRVFVAFSHSCAINSNDRLKCWGSNTSGRTAMGTTSGTTTTPTLSVGISATVLDVALEQNSLCVLGTDQKIYCTGFAGDYRADNPYPSQSFSGTTYISSIDENRTYLSFARNGSRSCGLTTTGTILCWGLSGLGKWGFGQLPLGTRELLDSGPFTELRLSTYNACAKNASNKWVCWGDINTAETRVPTPLLTRTGVTEDLLFGTYGSCFVNGSNQPTHCWGSSLFYAGQVSSSRAPAANSWSLPFQKIASTPDPSSSSVPASFCGITTTGGLFCWGQEFNYKTGIGHPSGGTPVLAPLPVDHATNYLDVQIGSRHSCALSAANQVKCWGRNSNGETGMNPSPSYTRTPNLVDNTRTYTKIGVGDYFSCGIATGGLAYCWGWGNSGRLGNGSTSSTNNISPIAVVGGHLYSDLKLGRDFACGLVGTKLYCWGASSSGQTGTGTTARSSPTAVDAATDYTSLAVGSAHACAITSAQALKCWGHADGNGVGSNISTPTVIDSGTSYTKVYASGSSTCAVTTTGDMKCWGLNDSNQFGNGLDLVGKRLLPF